jgi:hypothetical protein
MAHLADKDYFGLDGIAPIEGEPGRFHVPSSRPKQPPYVVDLAENQGNGSCSCPDYYSRRLPAIKEGQPLFTRATSCWHLIRARNYFCTTVLRSFAQKIKAAETEFQTPF